MCGVRAAGDGMADGVVPVFLHAPVLAASRFFIFYAVYTLTG